MYNKNLNMSAPSVLHKNTLSAKSLKDSAPISVSANQMQPAPEEPAAVMKPKCTYAVQREKTWLDGRTYFEFVPEPNRFRAMKILPQEVIEARKESHMKQLERKENKKGGFASIKEQNENYFRNLRKDTKLKKCVLHRPKHGWGRVYGDDRLTFRALERFSRNTLLADYYGDYDLENAQGVIILNAAIDEGDKCDSLGIYCKERKAILARGMEKYQKSRDVIKKIWTALLNGGGIPEWYDEPLAYKVQTEIRAIAKKIKQANPELYESMRQKVMKEPEKFKAGDDEGLAKAAMRSMMSVWFQHYEVRIVAKVLEWCEKEGLLTKTESDAYKDKVIFGYIYDGFVLLNELVEKWCKRTGKTEKDLLATFMEITDKETGFEMVWTCKPFDEKFDIQEQMVSVMAAPVTCESKKLTGDMSFPAMAEEFEKTRCFIQNVASYLEVEPSGEIIIRGQAKMKEAYNRLWCGYDEKGRKISFINTWITNNDELRTYDRMNIYPNTAACPPNEFNLWIPFAMERVEEFTWRQDVLDDFIYFVKHVICGHKEYKGDVKFPTPQYDYMMDWLAHLVQHPEQKPGKCPVLVSKQGSGKGTLTRIIKRILGAKRVFQSENPARDVWGDFNPMMEQAILVILDESDKKVAAASEGQLKNYITEENMTINNKFCPAHVMTSHHRFMVHTNTPDGGVQMQDGDRRFFAMKMSDHKKGDMAYWAKWNKVICDTADDSAFKTIYDWLMARDIGDFMQKDTPKTDFQKELERSNKEPIDSWLEDMAVTWRRLPENSRTIKEITTKELPGAQVFADYTRFCEQEGFERKAYNTNSNGLSSRINNHDISYWGGETGKGWKATEIKRGGGNNFRVFRLNEMWNYYVEKGIFNEGDFAASGPVEDTSEDAAPVLPPPAAPVLIPAKKKIVIKQVKGQQALKLGAQPDTDEE